MILGAAIFSIIWVLIALLLRHYPETMAGYNTMPRERRAEIDIQKLGRFISNVMFAGVPSVLLSPLMPSVGLYSLLLCWIPCSMLIVAGIYVNVRKDKFKI